MFSDPPNLTNHFLMAMPSMADPTFDGTLILLAEHSSDGALGVVINRPMQFDLGSLFEQIDLKAPSSTFAGQSVFFGGPVQSDRGFVLHRPKGDWHATVSISADLALTSSRDILESMAEHSGPEQVLVSLGYSGWGPGQLETELQQNAWLSVKAESSLVFDTPSEQRLTEAYSLLGVDPTLMHGAAGHA
ncbi:MAG: YqgE/AlgH family protein [Burkholderiaceae bacterium]